MQKLIKIQIIIILLCAFSLSFAQNKNNTQAARLLKLARRYEQLAQFSRSLELYQKLWNEDVNNINYYQGVKRNLVNLKKYDEALIASEKMIKIKPDPVIKANLGDIYYKNGQHEKAFTLWNEMITSQQKNKSMYRAVASSMIRNRLYEEAIEIYDRARDFFKEKNVFLLETANLYRAQLDYNKAVLLYIDYLKVNPNQYSYIEYSITNLTSSEEAINIIEKVLLEKLKEDNKNVGLRNLLAALYMRTSNYKAALEEFSLIDQYVEYKGKKDKRKIGSELFKFAQNANNDGAYEYAIQAFHLLLTRYPNSPYTANAKFGIAAAYEKSGEYVKSIEIYNDIITSFKKSPYVQKSLFRIGEINLEKFAKPVDATGFFKKVLDIKPFKNLNFEAIFKIGDCYVMQNLLEDAKNWYLKCEKEKSSPDWVEMRINYEIGKIEYWLGNFDLASTKFLLIQQNPLIITDKIASNLVNDALEYSMIINENEDNSETLKKYATAELLFIQKKSDKAIKFLIEVSQKDSSGFLADDALIKIGIEEKKGQEFERAVNTFQRIIDDYPESLHSDNAQKMIGEVYEYGFKDYLKAQQSYELVITTYPYSIYLEEVRIRIRELEKYINN